jgi:hypothetical protein
MWLFPKHLSSVQSDKKYIEMQTYKLMKLNYMHIKMYAVAKSKPQYYVYQR